MGGRRNYQNYTILDGASATGSGNTINVEDYRFVVLSFATDGSGTADLTVNVRGSIQTEAPNFDNAQSVDNHWENIEVVDLQDGAPIDGDTGISVAAADDYRLLQVNADALKWLTVSVSAYTAGSVTVKCKLFN